MGFKKGLSKTWKVIKHPIRETTNAIVKKGSTTVGKELIKVRDKAEEIASDKINEVSDAVTSRLKELMPGIVLLCFGVCFALMSIVFLALGLTFLMIDFLQFPAALAYSITGIVLLLLCLAMIIKGYHSISQGQSAKGDEVIAVSDTKSDVL